MNHSILVVNILHGLRGACLSHPEIYDDAETVFFRWLDKKEEPLDAEALTIGWIEVHLFLCKAIPMAVKGWEGHWPENTQWTPEVEKDLINFFKRRYENWAKKELSMIYLAGLGRLRSYD